MTQYIKGQDIITERGVERWDAKRGIHTLEPNDKYRKELEKMQERANVMFTHRNDRLEQLEKRIAALEGKK